MHDMKLRSSYRRMPHMVSELDSTREWWKQLRLKCIVSGTAGGEGGAARFGTGLHRGVCPSTHLALSPHHASLKLRLDLV